MDLGTLMDMNMVEPMMIVTIGDLGEVSDVNGVATLLPCWRKRDVLKQIIMKTGYDYDIRILELEFLVDHIHMD